MYAGMIQLNASHKQEAAEAAEMLEAGRVANTITATKYDETIQTLAHIDENLEKRGILFVESLRGEALWWSPLSPSPLSPPPLSPLALSLPLRIRVVRPDRVEDADLNFGDAVRLWNQHQGGA